MVISLPSPSEPDWPSGGEGGERWLGGDAGREKGAVFFAGLFLTAGEGFAARVLPDFAGIIPVKAKLAEVGADAFNGRFRERNPNPFANYFGKGVLGRHPAAERFEDFFNWQF